MLEVKKLFTPVGIFVFLIFLLAFFLRANHLNTNLFFGPEQGIDFLKIKEIALNHNVTLIGPKTDIEGVFHGPLYYYTMTIPFLLFSGNPLSMAYFFVFLNALTAIFIYFAEKEMFNKRAGILASIFFTISYGTIVYSHWLSGHPLTIPISALFIFFLFRYLKGRDYNLIIAAFLMALIGQAAFLNFLFNGFFAVLLIIVFRKRFASTQKKYLLVSLFVAAFVSIANFVLFDLTHQFLMSKNLLLLLEGKTGFHQTLQSAATRSITVFVSQLNSFLLPFSKTLLIPLAFLGVGIFTLVETKNKTPYFVLLFMILVPLVVLTVLKQDSLEQFFVLTAVPSVLLASGLIDRYFKNKVVFTAVSGLLICINSIFYLNNYSKNVGMFFQAPQPDLKLSDQKAIISRIDQVANGKSFFYQSFTIPYWSQQGWDYLFWYYSNSNQPQQVNPDKLFVITQSTGDPGQQSFEDNWLNTTVSGWGDKEQIARYGILSLYEIKQK